MNAMAARHLAWKERSLLTPLSIGFLLLFLVIVVCCCFSFSLNHTTARNAAAAITTIFITVGVIHGLACGIFMYAPERENGTFHFLEQLPVPSSVVGSTKYFWSAANVIGFNLAAMAVAAVAFYISQGVHLSIIVHDDQSIFLTVGLALMIPTTTYLWSLLSSRLVSSPLYATFLAAFLAGSGAIACLIMSGMIGDVAHPAAYAVANLTLILVLGLINYRLGLTWLRPAEYKRERQRVKLEGARSSRPLKPTLFADLESEKRDLNRRINRSLKWQAMRFFRLPFAICVCYSVLFLVFSSFGTGSKSHYSNFFYVALVGSVVGILTFAGDQYRNGFLFFREQGFYPRKLWASRIGFIVVCGLLTLVVSTIVFRGTMQSLNAVLAGETISRYLGYEVHQQANTSYLSLIIVFLVSAGAGQFCSMFIRSPIFLIAGGMILCFLVCCWAFYIDSIGSGSINYVGGTHFYPVVFTLPLAISFFFATWWFAPRWISGASPVKNRVLACSGVIVVAALCVFGFADYRMKEFSGFDWDGTLETYQGHYEHIERGEPSLEYKAAIRFKEALGKLVPVDDLPGEWIEKLKEAKLNPDGPVKFWPAELVEQFTESNAESIELVKEGLALQNPVYAFRPLNTGSAPRRLSLLISANTESWIRKQNPEKALESLLLQLRGFRHFVDIDGHRGFSDSVSQFLRWGEMEGQSPEKVLDGIKKLDEAWRQLDLMQDPYTKLVVCDFQDWMKGYRNGITDSTYVNRQDNSTIPFFWEITRSENLWLQNAMQIEKRIELLKAEINEPGSYSRSGMFHDGKYEIENPFRQRFWTLSLFQFEHRFDYRKKELLHEAQLIRYTKLRWALAAFKLKEGQYPRQLNDLVPGYLGEVPVDVFGGGYFYYQPIGLHSPVIFSWSKELPNGDRRRFHVARNSVSFGRTVTGYSIPAETPFLLPVAAQESGKTHWWLPRVRLDSLQDPNESEKILPQGPGIVLSNPVLDLLTWSSEITLKP